jgi:GntR family transcriptional regulator/MocR family aminotransferase
MRIPLNRESTLPLYKQIQGFLQDQIQSGGLAPKSRLPASRELATSLGVGRLTVINAYEELEAQGLIYGMRGNGMFVASPPEMPGEIPVDDAPTWLERQLPPPWVSSSQQLDELIASAARPGLISFAEGGGDSSLFPLGDFRTALRLVLRDQGREALAYGESSGYKPLLATIAQILTAQGIPALPDQVLITSGSQQAVGLVMRLLVRPGDAVLAESPTHMGFIDLCRSLNASLIEVPVDEQGMRVDLVEALLRRHHPRLIYTVPNFQNPTGACLNSQRRRQLLALAESYQVPLVEDDFVGDLRYRGAAQPALKALDRGGAVIYVSTFSKMLIPSLRIGFLVTTRPVLSRLLALKHTSDVATSNLTQRVLEAYITVGRYQACLRRLRHSFGQRRNTMLAALSRYMPPGTRWTTPSGGLFIWLQLPGGLSADAFFPTAGKAGVIYAPGSFFFYDGCPRPLLRLNFARQPPEIIEEGINRLGSALSEYISTGRANR